MPAYGSTSTIITRVGATPEAFGFDSEDADGNSPQAQLEAFVDDLRARASDEAERYCDRVFGLQEGEVERIQGNGTSTISVSNYPVVAINEIRVGSSIIDPSNYQIEGTSARTADNAGIIERVGRRRWPRRRITVDYDWGYESPPGVVEQVVEDAVVEVLEKAVVDRESSGKSSESMDGYQVSWDNSDAQQFQLLNESMRTKLEPLRRRGMA